MFSDLTPDQKSLALAMSDVSEAAYCAGWMEGLEYALWHLMTTGETRYGRSRVTKEEIEKLQVLSGICGGWIVWDDKQDQTFIAATEWHRMFQEGYAAHRSFVEDHSED
jgi:hypothetical protein